MGEPKDKDPVLFEVSKFLASALLIFMVKEFDSVSKALGRADGVGNAIALYVTSIYCANIFRVMHSMLRLQCWKLFYEGLTLFGASWRGSFWLFTAIIPCLLVPYYCLNSLKSGCCGDPIATNWILMFLIAPVFAYVGLDWVVHRSVIDGNLKTLAKRWLIMDGIAGGICVVVAGVRLCSPKDVSYLFCLNVVGVILLALFFVDYWLQRMFYFPPRETTATK